MRAHCPSQLLRSSWVAIGGAVALSLTPALAQNWADGFESYAPGSALEGQGGWVGWDGVQTSFSTVSTVQARTGSRSVRVNPGADSVQQFTAPTSGVWVLSGHVFIPAGFSSQLDFMVMNRYQHFGPYEWGSWLRFNGPAGTVTCNCGGSGAAVHGMVFDRWIEIRQVIDLDMDRAEVYLDGALMTVYTWSGGYSGTAGHLVPSIEALDLYATGVGDGLFIDDLSLAPLSGTLGTGYCGPAPVNSVGTSGELVATGFTQVAANDVTLAVSGLPLGTFGLFLASRTQAFVPNPGGSAGNLCLGGGIGRYVLPGQIKNSGQTGSFDLVLDLSSTPQPQGLVAIVAGETWNFQCWYRDLVGGQSGSNFTDAVSIAFN